MLQDANDELVTSLRTLLLLFICRFPGIQKQCMPCSLSFSYIVTQASATVQVQLSNDSKVKKGSEQVESLSNGAELAVA